MGKQRGIMLGCMAEPLTEQLSGNLPVEVLQRFEDDAQAINRLHVRGVLAPSETEKARRRLVKAVTDACRAKRDAKEDHPC